MTYNGLPLPADYRVWLDLFRNATPEYAPQPYQHLAKAYHDAGHESETRRILVDQRDSQVARGAITDWRELVWARTTGVLLGYGYKPWRSLLALVGIFIIWIVLTVVLGEYGALTHPRDTARQSTTPSACAIVERVGVGLDLGTPILGNARTNGRCVINQDPSSVTGTSLMSRLGGGFTVDLGEDGVGVLGPGEGLAAFVPADDELANRGDELADGVNGAAADGLAGNDPEEHLDHVQPGRRGRGEMQLHPGVALEPRRDLGAMPVS